LEMLLPHLVPTPAGRPQKTAALPQGTGAGENGNRLAEGENTLPLKAGVMQVYMRDRKVALDIANGGRNKRGRRDPGSQVSQQMRDEPVTVLPAFLALMSEHYIKARSSRNLFECGAKLDAEVHLQKASDAKLIGTVTVAGKAFHINIGAGKRGLTASCGNCAMVDLWCEHVVCGALHAAVEVRGWLNGWVSV